ncbi:hypothetical protein CWRG_00163 [Chthonomonas calidirosea]|uniref:DUF6785 family protein n=1 Tax=Chthonomonas calidirosea TaxID=454171 RepID=UPI0006DD44B2|nr:DUF6785 family protein [Chthonomonas calidirosea]CEK12710.1 hypothetical protein CWRG_00163 [Chthonomonas calidirosea]
MAVSPSNLSQSKETPARSALSLKALLIGLICVGVTCVLVCYAELVVGKIQIGYLQLPPVVVGMLALILGIQAILRKLSERLSLAQHELYTIYVMMLLASMVSSRGIMEKLIPLLVVPNYFASPTNGWASMFFKWIPKWAVPWDPHGPPKQFVAARFFDGLRPGEHIPWALWAFPLVAWGLFVGLLFTAFLCLAALLRRQWADNERLTFPLAQLPLEMIRGENITIGGSTQPSFLKNRLMWLGFAIPAFVFGLKGLHQYAPAVPDITTDFDLNSLLFSQPPYNSAIGFFHVYISFMAIGFFYLLPSDLLFSLWFFFLLTRLEDILGARFGYQFPTMPMYGCKTYQGYQFIGCYLTLVGYMIYTARPYLRAIWSALWTWRRPVRLPGEENELLPYRFATFGLVGSVLLLALWLHLLGMSYWLALFELGVGIFVIALVMARSTSEAGMLMTETCFRPTDIYRMVGDLRNLGPANLTSLAFLDAVMLRDQRGLILTGFLDSMKLADGLSVRRRTLVPVFLLAFITALLVSGYYSIHLPYTYGAVQMYSYVYQGNPVWAFTDAASTMNHTNPNIQFFDILNFGIGILVTVLIVALRSRLPWFPFHPLGYALSGSWTMMVFWFPCLVAWVLKSLIIRYGGMKLYARLRPLFLGAVLGEFIMAILFTAPAIFNRFTPTPTFPWP